jgi:hypothetical protein
MTLGYILFNLQSVCTFLKLLSIRFLVQGCNWMFKNGRMGIKENIDSAGERYGSTVKTPKMQICRSF